MKTLWTRLTRSLRSLWSKMFRRSTTAHPTPPAPRPAPSPKAVSKWQKRRKALVAKLNRRDNGTKHYGSKRASSNHARSEIGKGKRSGRQ